jgi:hypothetical protein
VSLDIFGGKRVRLGKGTKPPGATSLRTGFDAVQQVAFADNADQHTLVVHHRRGADLPFEKLPCDLLNRSGRLDGDDRRNHDIARLQSRSPSVEFQLTARPLACR